MGRDKAALPFRGRTLLEHIVATIQPVVARVLVVAAPGQDLPDLPDSVLVTRDERSHEGPLAGLARGLSLTLPEHTFAFACSCDAPFVEPRVIEHLFERAASHDAAVPRVGGRAQPLLAVYRTQVREPARAALENGESSLRALLERIDVTYVPARELEPFDPELRSFVNLNTPDDYARALHLPEIE